MAQPGTVFELADVKLAHGVAAVVADRPVRNARRMLPKLAVRMRLPHPFQRKRRCLARGAVGRILDAFDLPDLPAQRDDVRGLADELERGRLVQPVDEHGEGALPVDLHQGAGVRLGG
jgi:hypothetical protein